jgi:hypothetical protein
MVKPKSQLKLELLSKKRKACFIKAVDCGLRKNHEFSRNPASVRVFSCEIAFEGVA